MDGIAFSKGFASAVREIIDAENSTSQTLGSRGRLPYE
jgi:hypothetical protein